MYGCCLSFQRLYLAATLALPVLLVLKMARKSQPHHRQRVNQTPKSCVSSSSLYRGILIHILLPEFDMLLQLVSVGVGSGRKFKLLMKEHVGIRVVNTRDNQTAIRSFRKCLWVLESVQLWLCNDEEAVGW
jgi:hypothetical protein